jgi:hypothetical protein
MSTQPNPHMGSSFDAFLAEEGLLEACAEQAIKELVAGAAGRVVAADALGPRRGFRAVATSQ